MATSAERLVWPASSRGQALRYLSSQASPSSDQLRHQCGHVRIGKIDWFVWLGDQSVVPHTTVCNPPTACFFDESIFIRPLAQNLVAARRGQRDDRGTRPSRCVAFDFV